MPLFALARKNRSSRKKQTLLRRPCELLADRKIPAYCTVS
ncbi:hypothetical protein KPSA1_06523 [Pseudomonas syringae pv. actinidiae]|uniref:Uncharacterized protein n=1 Tax=Pseudomonas syringae pv. actinidiae TaxID=103796 RepID=A0A2V0QIV0_PSESF|nr:hypothetical protein KPSA1_06523 [Pseudomonas syringae pv. actinidiae]